MLQDGEKGLIIQRDKKTYAVAPHIPCGVVSPDTLRKLADVIIEFYKQRARPRQRFGAVIEKRGFGEFKTEVAGE